MNLHRPLIALTATLGLAAAAEPLCQLRFATDSGDRLAGSFESLVGDRMVWNSPVLEQPSPFFLKSLLEMTLPSSLPEFKASHEATLKLTNGDTIHGQLASVTDVAVALDTWYAGRLTFNRLNVKDLTIDERPTLVFSGPISLDGWVQTTKTSTWTYDQGALQTTAAHGIGRDVNLPDECIIAFDVRWHNNSSLQFNFFTDDLTTDRPSRGYQLNCRGQYVNIQRLDERGQFINGTSMRGFRENEKVRVEVRASRRTGDICFYANGQYLAKWRDPGAEKGKFGKGIQFVPESGSTARISAITVSTWDGVAETLPDEVANQMMGMGRFQMGMGRMGRPEPKAEEATPKAKQDGRMKLRNGDSLEGEVTAIADGVITVKTPLAEVKLPVARVRTILLKAADLETPILRNGDVRAWFADGTSIVFCLDGMTKDSITGHSQTFGSATFKAAAFSRIDFNIHDPKIRDMREKEDG